MAQERTEKTSNPAGKKPVKGAKRLATQQKIIDAFEQVLLRGGLAGVGINAIVAEAGVGKGLIYHYFGGLEGLADAWMARADLKPSPEDIAGEALEDFQGLPAPQRLARIHVNYATMLKNRPAACQILAEDMRTGSALPKLLNSVRSHLGESHEALVTQDAEFNNPQSMAKIFVLQAAANYFALRANTSPLFNGIALDTEDGWAQVMGMLEQVALSSE